MTAKIDTTSHVKGQKPKIFSKILQINLLEEFILAEDQKLPNIQMKHTQMAPSPQKQFVQIKSQKALYLVNSILQNPKITMNQSVI